MAQLLRGVKVVKLAVLLTGDYQGTLAPGHSPVINGAIFSADSGATAR